MATGLDPNIIAPISAPLMITDMADLLRVFRDKT